MQVGTSLSASSIYRSLPIEHETSAVQGKDGDKSRTRSSWSLPALEAVTRIPGYFFKEHQGVSTVFGIVSISTGTQSINWLPYNHI